MKNKTKKEIRKICTNFSEDFKGSEVGTMSYALTEEQFNKLFEYIKKNFVAKGEVREMLDDLVEYISPWLEKPFRNNEFKKKITRLYIIEKSLE